jgi:radical SAM superfamily enzyme YgiQ (UPF0313 family)
VVTVTLIMTPNPVLGDPTMQINLGLLYVAASLEAAGHEVRVADLRDAEEADVARIPRAEFYGFSCTTAEIEDAKAMAAMLKKRDGKCRTMVGGAHATHLPEDCLDHFDYVVRGDGERAAVDIVEGRAGTGVVEGAEADDLDGIPFPARHLLPPERVFTETLFVGERYGRGPRSTAVISSRNCPFSCAFCANPSRRVRFRSPENFAAEVGELVGRYGCRHFKVVDDNFTLRKDRALEICEMLEPMDVAFRCHTRSALLDDELAGALARAGCEEIAFGVETADQRVLDLLNKKERVEDHERALRIAKEAGLRTKVYFMVALPGETRETIELNKEFMRRNGRYIDKWTISVFCPYPGCDIYKNPEKYGVTWMERDWRRYWLYADESLIETEAASRGELTEHIGEMRRYFISEEWKRA